MSTKENQHSIITDDIKEQILTVRDTGQTNMFMISNVQRIAYEMDLFDLALFLEDRGNHKSYIEFIMSGKR